jgi:hypothetical protein
VCLSSRSLGALLRSLSMFVVDSVLGFAMRVIVATVLLGSVVVLLSAAELGWIAASHIWCLSRCYIRFLRVYLVPLLIVVDLLVLALVSPSFRCNYSTVVSQRFFCGSG